MLPVRLVGRIAQSLWATALAVLVLLSIAVAVAMRFFELTLAGALSLYFVVWWTLLFAVLPFGVRSQAEAGDVVAGSEPGAPSIPGLHEKAIWTTLVTDVVFIITVALLPLSGL